MNAIIPLARMAFAREGGIPPDEVALTIEYAAGFFERVPRAADLSSATGYHTKPGNRVWRQ